MSPSQTRPPQPKKMITTQVLLNKDWNKWQQPLSKESIPCKVTKQAPKANPTILLKPRFSSRQLNLTLQHLRRDFTALHTTWNETYALTLSPTALEEFMTPLPNWNQLPSPVQDTKPPQLIPLPVLPETSWTDFLCVQDIEPSTGHSVYGTNAMSTWMGKTATTTPLDLEIFLPLAPSTPPHVLSLLTTPSEDKKIDELFLPPSLMITDTQSFTLELTGAMDNHPTMPLRTIYLSLMHLSIMTIPSLMNPLEPSMFVSSSSPRTLKANGTTVSGKLPPLTPFSISSARMPTIPAGLVWMDFFLKEGRMTVETVHMFPMKQPMQEATSGAKLSGLPMNKWHTWEHKNASNTPPSTSTG